jgi:CubicO group peptidase (beta-lactamase class C family)
MKSHLLILSITILLFTAFSPLLSASAQPGVPASSPEIDTAALDRLIEAQMAKHALRGVALAVIQDGEVVYQQGYGTDGNGRPMTAQTPMLIGSQSKSFTALAIAQLAEAGKLDLNAPVQAYIPWFRVADETASSQITLNHLLHHTSGLSDAEFDVVIPLDASPEEAVRALAQARLTAPVGSKHQYFNLGFSVLAHVVEIMSGETYAGYVDRNIFTPLEMNASTADPFNAPGLARGYTRLFSFPIPANEPIPAYGAGEGFIVSTAEDMARYALAFLGYGPALVSPEMLAKILTPGLGNYGMGWFIVDGGTKIFHGGANQTFRTDVNLYPKQGSGFVLLGNQGYQIDHFVSAAQLSAGVEALVLGRTPVPVEQGWSSRWPGWGLGLLVLCLLVLHSRNFLALRGWRVRTQGYPFFKRFMDVAISFLIPSVILAVVFWQISSFYGNRFNLWTNLAAFRFALPDVFFLMLVGTLPDYIQGGIKTILWLNR